MKLLEANEYNMNEAQETAATSSTHSNIAQLFNAIDKYIELYENPEWPPRCLTADDIKQSFKLADSLECHLRRFEGDDQQHLFMTTLYKWWRTEKQRTYVADYDFQFLRCSCDHLLGKFFKCTRATETQLDISFRMYRSMCDRARFENFLNDLLTKSVSYRAIQEFIVNHAATQIDKKSLEAHLVHHDWTVELQCGRGVNVKRTITSLLAQTHKCTAHLNRLITILDLIEMADDDDDNEVEDPLKPTDVQRVILEILLEKMLDRSILSRTFWLTLVVDCDRTVLAKVCQRYSCTFLDALLKYCLYIGSMMVYADLQWTTLPVANCPEITFNELRSLLKSLCKRTANKLIIVERLTQATTYTASNVWHMILAEILKK